MSVVNYFTKKPMPDNIKRALLDLVDRLDYCYLRTDGTYNGLDRLVSDKVRYIHRLLDGGK